MTSHDVAALAGVSQATVSNVMNRPGVVVAETRERVLAAMSTLGFVVNQPARLLRVGHSATIGICVPDISNPFWADVAKGAAAAASDLGSLLIICASDQSPQLERRLLDELASQRVSGLLVSPASADLAPFRALRQQGTPVVLLDQRDPQGEIPYVVVDDVLGAGLVGRHLFGLGHKRVAVINGPHQLPWCEDRWRGMWQAAEDAGLDPADALVEIPVPELTAVHGEGAVDALLRAGSSVTATFCTNDLVALGVIKGLRERGVTVPEDMSLVGYDDDDFAGLLSPPLSTVRQEPFELGRKSVSCDLLGCSARVPPICLAAQWFRHW